MPEIIRVNGQDASLASRTSMKANNLFETTHLENWIKQHPEVIDPSLMIVTTQFGSWESESESARERPDILALSSSGELVVMELKRQGDRRVHLQAITYGALVSAFDLKALSKAHAQWVASETDLQITVEEARGRLTRHVDGDWIENVNEIPRLVIVAESYPAQVLTTVQWLNAVAPGLSIECYEYTLFSDLSGLFASFSRIFPVPGLDDRVLRPAVAEAKEELEQNRKSPRSTQIIYDHELIPLGAELELELVGHAVKDVADGVTEWVRSDPLRARVTWGGHPSKPLRWAYDDDPGQEWTPTALRNRVFELAGQPKPNFSAADAWSYQGRSLYEIAKSVRADEV